MKIEKEISPFAVSRIWTPVTKETDSSFLQTLAQIEL
jgi:hypothetical protein